jgi:hypothetical protein
MAGGQSRRTAARLSNAIDDRYMEVETVHGAEGARRAAASHTAAKPAAGGRLIRAARGSAVALR